MAALGLVSTQPAAEAAPGRVGPNAVIRLGEALRDRHGEARASAVFDRAGLGSILVEPPAEMVDERAAAGLFDALFAALPGDEAVAIAADAGKRTADYVLAHRIPRPAQAVLRILPPPLAARMLLRAIASSAWTFAGSGVFRARAGSPNVVEIAANPLAMPGCAWHVAVFERLFRALVSPRSTVRHTRCCDAGAPACRFEITTGARAAPGHAPSKVRISTSPSKPFSA